MAKKVETVESSASDKVKAALALLNKTFGDGSAMTFNNVEVKKDRQALFLCVRGIKILILIITIH